MSGWISSIYQQFIEKYPALLTFAGMPVRESGDGIGDNLEAADGLDREADLIVREICRRGSVGLCGGEGTQFFQMAVIGAAPDFQTDGREDE